MRKLVSTLLILKTTQNVKNTELDSWIETFLDFVVTDFFRLLASFFESH